MKEEMIRKAARAGSVDELIALASAGGIELGREKAEEIFSSLKSGGLIADDDLYAVSGGTGGHELDTSVGGGCSDGGSALGM